MGFIRLLQGAKHGSEASSVLEKQTQENKRIPPGNKYTI